jgi:hypothetical protein
MISGIMMAITASDSSSSDSYKTITAATLPELPVLPSIQKAAELDLSEDLVRDLAKQKGVLDTVYVTKTDTIKEQVTKVKVKKVPVPSNVIEVNVTARRDTIQVPVYYLATQVGNKEGPTGECISVYEVHKVDEICPEISNSSVESVIEQDNDVGE